MKKLFGKDLFSFRKPINVELYDFAKHGLLRSVEYISVEDIDLNAISGDDEISRDYLDKRDKNNKKYKEGLKKKKLTPKEVYELEALNDKKYSFSCDEKYIAKNIKSLQEKLSLLEKPKKSKNKNPFRRAMENHAFGASQYGYEELETVIERLDNRRKYEEYEDLFNQWPYTTSELINNVLKENVHLRAKRVEEFIPDMPDDAIQAMKEYKDTVNEMCGKNPVFYIIADKKDFEKTDQKRDPILLAQSPFALSWQILGAWDEEMIYLGDL